MNRSKFYAELRKRNSGVFGTSLSQGQVDGLDAKLDVWEKYFSDYPLTFLAAALGQSYRETGGMMMPILETHSKRNPCKSRKQAAGRLERAFKRGQLTWVKTRYWLPDSSGQIGVGGGDIQLTHRAGYVNADRKLFAAFGIKSGLSDDYDRILDPKISALVMFKGMIDGWFTSKKLKHYLKSSGSLDYRNARSIVNGDKNYKDHGGKETVGSQVNRFCKAFEKALRAADDGTVTEPTPPKEPVEPEIAPPVDKPSKQVPQAKPKGIIATILSAIIAFLTNRRKS